MRIIFDVSHPKDVNIFGQIIPILQKRGHDIKIYARVKENTRKLLDESGFSYDMGFYYYSMLGKVCGIITNDIKLYNISKRFKPDIFVSPGSPYAAHVSKLMGVPHIAFPDTEIASLVSKIAIPFTDKIYTSTSFYLDFGAKHERFDGYFELAYLHPNNFKPDKGILKKYNLSDSYIILRLSALASHHDVNAKGFSFENDAALSIFIESLEKYGQVLVFSETDQNNIVKEHQLSIDPMDFHHVLFFSKLCIGEGATMASEAAILGVPSIYVSNTDRGYLNELETKYGLVLNISNTYEALERAIELLEDENTILLWRKKRESMLNDKIDITQFIVEAIEMNVQ